MKKNKLESVDFKFRLGLIVSMLVFCIQNKDTIKDSKSSNMD